ncbi:hypothetical protein [Paludisphaera soli]|uniref:hypothetical protein n=1 Tax=Paludisphaera soli TaxID=2712865 RepID=UPI0013EA9C65|nr:hypothetical protein [Paludisphaera soli]
MIPPVPPLEDLQPFKAVAASIGLTITAAHRWRHNPDTPFHAWKVGREWMTTEAAAAEFIRLRTERASRGRGAVEGPPSPRPEQAARVLDRHARRLHQAAKAANDRAGW